MLDGRGDFALGQTERRHGFGERLLGPFGQLALEVDDGDGPEGEVPRVHDGLDDVNGHQVGPRLFAEVCGVVKGPHGHLGEIHRTQNLFPLAHGVLLGFMKKT